MNKKLILALAFPFIFCASLLGQQTEFERQRAEQDRAAQEKAAMDRTIQMMSRNQPEGTYATSESMERLRQEGAARIIAKKNNMAIRLKKEDIKYLNSLHAVNSEDTAKYKDFLAQPKTGIFRLFPNFDCDQHLVVRVDGPCADAVSFSSSYSFRQKSYSNDTYVDIQFKNGKLISDGFFSQGILSDLGNIPLTEVSAADSSLRFLYEFNPEKKIKDARDQYLQIAKGINDGHHLYGNIVEVKKDTTYAARFIAYKIPSDFYSRFIRKFPLESSESLTYLSVNSHKRTDLTIAFSIVRIDADGSLTILWKEISQQKSPKLIFEKNDRLADIKPEKLK